MGRAHGPGPIGLGLSGPGLGPMDLGPWAQYLDPTFRVNVAEPLRLSTKNCFPEFIRGFPGFPGFPRNCPNQAGLALGSRRAEGKYDGSSHKLLQKICEAQPWDHILGEQGVHDHGDQDGAFGLILG